MKRVLMFAGCGLLLTATINCTKQKNGLNSMIDMIDVGAGGSCPLGGILVKTGLDKNRNDILDSTEVQNKKYVCNGLNGTNANSDKQIFLPIPNSSSNTTRTTPSIVGELIKFRKGNYPGVDSIVFLSNPYVGNPANTSIVELYNVTDSVPIANSRITANTTSFNAVSFQQSGNIYGYLPAKEITLAVSCRSGTSGMFAASGSGGYLILYRK